MYRLKIITKTKEKLINLFFLFSCRKFFSNTIMTLRNNVKHLEFILKSLKLGIIDKDHFIPLTKQVDLFLEFIYA